MAQYKSRFNEDSDDEGSSFRGSNNRRQNPFHDDDDDDNNYEDVGKSPEFLSIQREKELLEQRMIDSSYRSVNMINESQQIASDTAQDLNVQREKLERTNRTLDAMQDDLNESDRNITSLKSIWGTMSNWFKKGPAPKVKPAPKANATIDEEDDMEDEDFRGGRVNDDDLQRNLRKLDDIEPVSRSARSGGGSSRQQQAEINQPTDVNAIVDQNLDNMLAGLTVLKTQGLALGDEIESQNSLLDDIYGKVEKTDNRITTQEGKIRKILKK